MEIMLLRAVHVLSGAVWAGTALFLTYMLGPALAQAGPGGGAVMAGLHRRGMNGFLPTVGLLTILSGLRLLWLTSAGLDAFYFASARGVAFAVSGGAAVLAFLLAMTVTRLLAVRMAALAAAGPGAAPHLPRLQARSRVLGHLLALLMVVAVLGMGTARYLG